MDVIFPNVKKIGEGNERLCVIVEDEGHNVFECSLIERSDLVLNGGLDQSTCFYKIWK